MFISDWATGGEDFSYHTLDHCLDGDTVTMIVAIMCCLGVFTGYMMIALRWSAAAKQAPDGEAKRALRDLMWIFLLCGLCGYLWVMVEAVWPGWRLYIVLLLVLNFFTWRYVLFSIRGLEQVYTYLRDRDQMVSELVLQREEIRRLRQELGQDSLLPRE